MEPELREVRAEARLRTGDAEIGNERKAEATTNRGAVDCSHDRLAGPKQADRFEIEMLGCTVARTPRNGAVGRKRAAVAEIRAGAERFTLRRQNDRAAIRVVVELLERVGQRLDQLHVEEIVRRAPDLHGCDEIHDIQSQFPARLHAGLRVQLVRPSCRVTISASTTDTPFPCACTMTGLRSISVICSACSAANRDSETISAASPSMSAPSSSAFARRPSSSSRASSAEIGAGASSVSRRTSAWMPPKPTISMAPNTASRLAPTIISIPACAICCTSTPRISAPGRCLLAFASTVSYARATASAPCTPSATAPAWFLCGMSGDWTLSATKP